MCKSYGKGKVKFIYIYMKCNHVVKLTAHFEHIVDGVFIKFIP